MRRRAKTIAIIIFCVLIGYFVRITYLMKYPVPVRDSYTYQELIERWDFSSKTETTKVVPPLSLFFFKTTSQLLNIEIIKAAKLFNVEAGLLIIVLMMIITLKISSSTICALISGLVAATHPVFVELSCQMLRENSYLMFTCLAILSIMSYLKHTGLIKLVLASICVTLSFFCRYEGIDNIIISLLVILMFSQNVTRKKKVVHTLIFTATCAISALIITFSIKVPISYYMLYKEVILNKL